MAKRKYSKRRNNSGGVMGIKLPVAVIAGFVPGMVKVWEHWGGGVSSAAREAGRIYLGVDFWEGRFDWRWLWHGTIPIIIGAVVHRWVGGGLGINRALSRAGIPLIRL